MELTKSFLDDRNERELKMVYFLAQPNGINQEKSLAEFISDASRPVTPPKTEAEIMDNVKDILARFERGANRGDI